MSVYQPTPAGTKVLKLERAFVSLAEAGHVLSLNPRTILNRIHRGEIRAIRVGRVWRISIEVLNAIVAGGITPTESPVPA